MSMQFLGVKRAGKPRRKREVSLSSVLASEADWKHRVFQLRSSGAVPRRTSIDSLVGF